MAPLPNVIERKPAGSDFEVRNRSVTGYNKVDRKMLGENLVSMVIIEE